MDAFCPAGHDFSRDFPACLRVRTCVCVCVCVYASFSRAGENVLGRFYGLMLATNMFT